MLEGPQGAHADPPAHAVHRTGPARSPRADPPAANGLGIQKDPQGAIPLRALGPGPRTAPGPHKASKRRQRASADQTAPPDNAPRRGEARKATIPLRYLLAPQCRSWGPYAPQRRSGRPAKPRPPQDAQKARRGDPPAGLLGACGACGACGAHVHVEKRPPRARRPALPQPCAAVLSAKAGLTAGFGMGPG